MDTGFHAAFMVTWAQTDINGLEAAPVQTLDAGVAWSWTGNAVPVGGIADVVAAHQSDSADILRRRVAQWVERQFRGKLDRGWGLSSTWNDSPHTPVTDSVIVLTDGAFVYTATLIFVEQGVQPLLLFVNDLPPRDRELWVVHHTLGVGHTAEAGPDANGVICFTPGTRLATPTGPVAVETLQLGDLVLTKDNGPQPIEWIGRRRMTGARLFAMPHLRPVRIGAGALGLDRPDRMLLVSPNHRVLVTGATTRALFQTPEVLVAAKDLIDGQHVTTATSLREVTYIHLLLPQHNIVWANDVAIESFHPANTALSSLEARDRGRLIEQYPALTFDPYTYGGFARRNLTSDEAEILSKAA